MKRRFIVNTKGSDTIDLKDKRFKKQILRWGRWFHDNAQDGVFEVTKDKVSQLVKNFKEKVIENVPVLRGHHTQDEADANPDLIAGEIEDLELQDDGLYAVIKTTDDKADEQIGTKYKNVSLSIDEDYEDHESGDAKGWVARHLALTTEPYIKKLDPSFIALSEKEDREIVILNLQEENMKKKDKSKEVELEEEKKEEAQVEETKTNGDETVKEKATEEKAEEAKEEASTEEKADETKTEEAKIEETAEEEVAEENNADDVEEDVEGSEKEPKEKVQDDSDEQAELEADESNDTDLSESERKVKSLEKKVKVLEQKDIETRVNTYLSEGKILPAQRDVAMQLLQAKESVNLGEGGSKNVAELFETFVKNSTPQVDLSERGVQPKTNEGSDSTPKQVLGTMDEKTFKKYVNLYK